MCAIQSSLHHLVNVSFKPNLPDPEHILYAALAPCPQTFSVLKSACRTWEDHLWAQISILCEEKQTAEMIKLGGNCDPESSEYPTMKRFFAHLYLYLRMIDIPVPPLAT
ncbi:hypothetical protein EV702DRAFT_710396 [Suillus placidus]|uniref:Nuclear pore complex protein n=1 Tax=Suillus placidus TaxID=48579 RepID=A0A9P7CWS7_9AGAM|nr:hypothetical protein EV702DRAFT_710396 [Suillus placidus]